MKHLNRAASMKISVSSGAWLPECLTCRSPVAIPMWKPENPSEWDVQKLIFGKQWRVKTLTTTTLLEHAHCKPSFTDMTVCGSSSKSTIHILTSYWSSSTSPVLGNYFWPSFPSGPHFNELPNLNTKTHPQIILILEISTAYIHVQKIEKDGW